MKLVSEVSDAELAKTDSKYAPLINELEKAPSTDDIRAKFSKALSEWRKKQAEIPVRIDEAEKSKVDVDVAEQELAKADLERKISECDQKISSADKSVDLLRSESMKLKFDMSGIMQIMDRELSVQRREVENELFECNESSINLSVLLSSREKTISDNSDTIAAAENERKKLGEQYNAEKAKTFDETPYLFDESKWVFDENSTVCSLCGQKLPENKIEQLKTDFEAKKEIGQKVADQEQMLYLLEEFIRFKLDKVSESINSHFKTVNFKLFEMQLNGGMKDCCECTVNGVPYSTLNSGHRIVAGLDIIRSLSELYGVSVPIFVDNAESLNEFNVPDMDAQLILLSVSEDKQLKVEGV